jgi:RNA polymerase sigma factor (sigma-70 family)
VDYQHENSGSDRQLVERILSGETTVFSIVIKNTERLVAQLVFKMIDRPEDRKDITQDIYLKAFHQLKGFRFQSKLSTWVAQIAYTTCVNWLVKKKLVLVDNLSDDNEPAFTETEQVIFSKELSGILKNEIDKLPPLFKTLITLYHNEDQSYSAIGEITGLPDGTVKSYLSRARKKLRENILLTYKKEAL